MELRSALLLFVPALLTAGARAQCVLDQDQPNTPSYMAHFSQTDLAQSFSTPMSGICGAGIFLRTNIGSSDNVTISLWTALPNAGGVMIATGSTLGTQGTWVDVFWTSVSIQPNVQYFLVFDGNTTLGIAGDTSNPYPNGQVYANPGYGPFPSYDYTFRTYSGPSCGSSTSYCTAGTSSHGCAALMTSAGSPSASAGSGFTITANGVEGQKSGLFFYGIDNSGFTPLAWGPSSSFLCVKPPTQRTPPQSSGGTTNLCNGSLAMDFNAFIAANPTALGAPFVGSENVYVQVWYRDPPSPKTTHLSDGLHFIVCP